VGLKVTGGAGTSLSQVKYLETAQIVFACVKNGLLCFARLRPKRRIASPLRREDALGITASDEFAEVRSVISQWSLCNAAERSWTIAYQCGHTTERKTGMYMNIERQGTLAQRLRCRTSR
jgi:hypothetical protein